MKTISKKWSIAVIPALIIMIALAFTYTVEDDWDVPDDYVKMENPVEASDKSVKAGSELYKLHCKSCHGKYGEGDGPKADGLETFPGDFTTDEFHDQSDGAIFYKSKIGRDEMPEFAKKIPDDDEIWDLVNFIRTL